MAEQTTHPSSHIPTEKELFAELASELNRLKYQPLVTKFEDNKIDTPTVLQVVGRLTVRGSNFRIHRL